MEDFFRGAPDLGWPDYLLYLEKQQKLLEPENEPDRTPSRRVRELLANICNQRRVSLIESSLRVLSEGEDRSTAVGTSSRLRVLS